MRDSYFMIVTVSHKTPLWDSLWPGILIDRVKDNWRLHWISGRWLHGTRQSYIPIRMIYQRQYLNIYSHWICTCHNILLLRCRTMKLKTSSNKKLGLNPRQIYNRCQSYTAIQPDIFCENTRIYFSSVQHANWYQYVYRRSMHGSCSS